MGIIIFIVILILFIVGLIGSVLPTLPGPPLVFLGILVYAVYDGFEKIGWGWLVIFFVVTLLTLILDYLAAAIGTKKAGASQLAAVGSVIGGFLGLIMFNILGLILGTFLGAVMAELVFNQKPGKLALKAGMGSLIGFLAGTVVKFFIAVAMILLFLLKIT